MAKTVTLTSPGSKAHYSQSNIGSDFSSLNSNFSNFLHLGGTGEASNSMTGVLDMGGYRVSNAGTPSLSADLATKAYVDQTLTISTTAGTIGSLLDDADADTGVNAEATADLDRLDLFAATSTGADNAIQIVGAAGSASALTNPYVDILKHVVLGVGVRIGDAAGADTYLELNRSGSANHIYLVAGGNQVMELDSASAIINQHVLMYDNGATAAGKRIGDEDGDTYIYFNNATGGTDDDTIRFYCAGVEVASFSGSTINLGGGALTVDDLLTGGTSLPGDGEDNVIIMTTGTTVTSATNIADNTIILYSVVNTGVQNDLKIDFKTGASTKATLVLGKDCTFPNDVAVSNDLTVTGVVTINDTTTSTSKDTGALIVEGGVGIEKNVYIGGTLNVAGATTISDGTVSMKYSVYEIGDWNMDTTASVNVAHGLGDFTKIRMVDVYIRDDTDSNLVPLYRGASAAAGDTDQYGYWTINSTNITLVRETGSTFDGTSYDSTSYNRGWVTVWYAT